MAINLEHDELKFESRLTDTEKEEIKSKYTKIKQQCIQYNDGKGDFCLRLKEKNTKRHTNPARIRVGHAKELSDAAVAYGAEYGELPSKYDKRVMVHICGNPVKTKKCVSRCINGSHIKLETVAYNNQQQTCHSYIRRFESKY